MKRAGHLFEKVTSFKNLWSAATNARRGKRRKYSTAAFDVELERELLRLEEDLIDGTYRPGGYTTFTITDPKPRLISAAPYRDRVLQHAVANVIGPILERYIPDESYACRPGKGTHAALVRASHHAAATAYVLKCDVKKYFPSMDHEILKGKIRRLFKDRRLLSLLDLIIDTSNPQEEVGDYFPGDDLFTPFERRKGIPIGNLLSQHFANLYLAACDRHVTQVLRCGRYIRYADDMLVFADDKASLAEVRDKIASFLCGERLRLNQRKSVICRCDKGIPFVGFLVSKTHRRVRPIGKRRAFRRIQRMKKAYANGGVDPQSIAQSIASRCGHAQWGKSQRLVTRFLSNAVFQRNQVHHLPQIADQEDHGRGGAPS
jgi:retron-type reverse transcriptase